MTISDKLPHFLGLQHQTLAFVVGETFFGVTQLFLDLVALFWVWGLRGTAYAVELVVTPPIKGTLPATDSDQRSYAKPCLLC
jgi:hypothetical protein